MGIYNKRNLLFFIALLTFLPSCVNHNGGKDNVLYYPIDSLSSATSIDSVSSDDGKIKIYTVIMPSDGNVRQYNTVMLYRTETGVQQMEKRAVLDIVNSTDYGCYLPVECIYQSTSKGKTIYLLQLDNMENTAHDNSILVAMQICGDSIKPVNIFRNESRDMCIVENKAQYN